LGSRRPFGFSHWAGLALASGFTQSSGLLLTFLSGALLPPDIIIERSGIAMGSRVAGLAPNVVVVCGIAMSVSDSLAGGAANRIMECLGPCLWICGRARTHQN
jgi:hypothetical protein